MERPAVGTYVWNLPTLAREMLIGRLNATANLTELSEFFDRLICRFCRHETHIEHLSQSQIGLVSCATCKRDLGEGDIPNPMPRDPPTWLSGSRDTFPSSEFCRRFDEATARAKKSGGSSL